MPAGSGARGGQNGHGYGGANADMAYRHNQGLIFCA